MSDSSTTPPINIPSGLAWMVVSGMCFVCVSAIVRGLGSDMPAPQASFIRYLFGLILFLPLLYRVRAKIRFNGILGLHAIRGVIHSLAIMLWFFAMARIPITEVTAISYVAPLFTTIGAALFFSEKLHGRRIGALIIGFVGMLIILRPGFQVIEIGSWAQFMAAPLFAASFLFTKKLTQTEDTLIIVMWLSVFCTLGLVPGAIWFWRTPTMEELGWLFLVALLATAGHFTLTQAFRNAPITVLQPVQFLQLVWAALIDVALFHEGIDPYVIAGGAIIVFAASYIAHRERQASKRATASATPDTQLGQDT